jgi:hypothetical protein
MEQEIHEIKILKKAVAAGIAKVKAKKFAKKQKAADAANKAMRAKFNPKTSQPKSKSDLQPARRARADLEIKKAIMAGKV